MPKVVEKRKHVLTLKQKVDICQRLERGESRQQLMMEYGVGSSTIYDIVDIISLLFKYPATSGIWHVGGPVDSG